MSFSDFQLIPDGASTLASKVDALYFFALAVSAFFSLLIAVLIFFFFVRYRRRIDGPQVGERIHGSTPLEIVWSAIPFVITMVMFVWGAMVYYEKSQVPADAEEFLATGKQWMWKFQHPEGHREINALHVPVGKRIRITMTSEDVIHSLFIPAFRIKQDVLPGRYTTLWFEATRPGTYHLFCAEYCGAEHSRMIGSVYVMEQDDYQDWLSGGRSGLTPAESGAALFTQHACDTCHKEQRTGRGPSLHGIAGQQVRLASGRTLTRDDAYLRQSIVHPGAELVAGYPLLMPTFQGQITEEGILHLIAYLKSLSAPAAEYSPPIPPEGAEQGPSSADPSEVNP
ncbi:MAG TPA: cytochrome c oxidase subunit II [Thermoanaerobaculia bacterium]|jgi:cytochrome c oxidase subunit 2